MKQERSTNINIDFIGNPFEMRLLNLRIHFLLWTFVHILVVFFFFFFVFVFSFGARGAANRGVESLRFQMSIVRRYRFQFLPKPTRGLLGQKRDAIDNNYGRQQLLGIQLQDSAFLSEVAVNHLKTARGEIWPKRSEKKNYQYEDKSPQ